ncbi:MAG: SGNH/GDSL hydrolase family protein, partial [Candidatus Electrothrix sp. AR4]|nr:SGNH/GDSL hydrolase family protein [Candidatus Electrothrix sp. AR4]
MSKKTRKKLQHATLVTSIATVCLLLPGNLVSQHDSCGKAYAAPDSGKIEKNASPHFTRWDMSSFMVLGDSIAFGCMAGYKEYYGDIIPQIDARLVPHAWPKLVADQAEVEMMLPFHALNPDNLAVPGYTLGDVNTEYSVLVGKNEATQLVMGYYYNIHGDLSPVNYILAENPSTLAVMIGNNDILGSAINANTALKTPIPSFEEMYSQMISDLADNTNRAIVVSTIPDVSNIPFLQPAVDVFPSYMIPYLSEIAFNEDGTEYTVQTNDYITLAGIQKLQNNLPLKKCPQASAPSFTCVGEILTQDEVERLSGKVINSFTKYNAIRARIPLEQVEVLAQN